VGVKDFCTYWFRKAHQHLKPGQRAGLVGTNSISQNKARSASLEYLIAEGGTITDAVSSQKWPGEAKVHVSLISWTNGTTDGPITLNGVSVAGIDSSLHGNAVGAWGRLPLVANKTRCFQGPIPVGAGFIISEPEAGALLTIDDADYREVIRPYLTSEDIAEAADQGPSRWVVDFGTRSLENAKRFTAAIDIVRIRVKPERDKNRDRGFREVWWRFGRPRTEMRAALAGRRRYAATGRHGKRFLAAWIDPWTMASDATCVFAFEDDFSMGVLQSRTHVAWAWAQSSTLKGDLRYTPTSVFMSFPWAAAFASSEQRERVADACRRLLARRSHHPLQPD